jgi:hypothetical protein
MVAYLVLQLRGGDMLSMYRLYSNRQSAYQFIENDTKNLPDAWWKVLPVYSGDIQAGLTYDIVVHLQWETTNHVAVVGVYDPGMIPQNILQNYKFNAETLTCV